MTSADIRLRAWLAGRAEPYVTRQEALALGFTDRMIHGRVSSGWWHRTSNGVFRIGLPTSEWRPTLVAATSKLRAVVSHHSAAQIHDFPATPRGKLVVTVQHHSTNRYPGVEVRQATDLTSDQVQLVNGMRVTSPARTFLDIAQLHRLRFLIILLERLTVSRGLDPSELAAVLELVGRRGKPGTVKTRMALSALYPELRRLESELERVVLGIIRRAGLPMPDLQMDIPWRSLRSGRIDMVFPQFRLIIECDGRRWHSDAVRFEDDRRRDNEALLAGWRVLRITWKMATEDPVGVADTIRSAIDMG